MIELRNISKTYKFKKGVSTKSLDEVSIKLPDTGLIFIVGKSTLLNLISGLDKEGSNEIIVDGKVIYNTLNNEIVSTQSFTSIKSKLPFKDKLKFALLNLGRHKIRLIFTILLICASLTFLQISKNIGNADIIYTHREALNNLNSNYIDIKKYEVIGNSLDFFERYFNNENRKEIIKTLGDNYLLK